MRLLLLIIIVIITLIKIIIKLWKAAVKEKYAPDGILRDWNGEHKGSDKVESACAGIFEAVPNIRCDILTMHLSAATNTVIAELSIYINDTTTLLGNFII